MNLSPFGVVAYLIWLWWISRNPRDSSWERYLWSIAHDRFVLYITCVLVCGFIHKLSISAVISEFERFIVYISKGFTPLILAKYKNVFAKVMKTSTSESLWFFSYLKIHSQLSIAVVQSSFSDLVIFFIEILSPKTPKPKHINWLSWLDSEKQAVSGV